MSLEAAVVWLVFHFFALLPIDAASALGGWIGRTIGPRLPITRRARQNLKRIFPDWPEDRYRSVIVGMWDNVGRVAGEYPHLSEFTFGPGGRISVSGGEHLEALRDDGRAGLCFSAHFGNWELLGRCAAHYRLRLNLIYRAANNPKVNWIFAKGRQNLDVELLPKGAAGARRSLELLRAGEHIGMLVDQKMNDGILVPFFGIDAWTAPALAAFALKYKCPVVAAHIVRTRGAHFHMTLEPPVHFEDTGNRHQDIARAMTDVNRQLEGWIRERPDQWLWLHKRWPDEGTESPAEIPASQKV